MKVKSGNKIERIFACIRYAMDPESQPAPEMREKDWLQLFDFADEQAISGVMFDGRRKMADEAGMRDDEGFFDDLTLEWGFVAQQIESKYRDEEKLMVHFLKRGRKMMNAGEMKEPRLSKFKELLTMTERYKHVNQWK